MTSSKAGAPTSLRPSRVAFLDNIRYLMILFVVVYHSVAAYATVVPWWGIRDTSFFAADIIREFLDVFIMPILFFVSGYFALTSLKNKGGWGFVKDKAVRLLIPWVLAVMVVWPLLFYDTPTQLIRPFREYWLSHLESAPIRLAFLPQTLTQGPFWFISLLFAFFVIFALLYSAARRWPNMLVLPAVRKITSRYSRLQLLALFGVLTSIVYFAVLLLIPDTSWLTLSWFLEFQPTRIVLFASYFALGVYVQTHRWFDGGMPLGRITLWGAVTAVLALAYIVMAQTLYAEAQGLSVIFLLSFAFIRSFFLLSLLVVIVSAGIRYWNRSSRLDLQLSKTSYNIYLSHLWFVVILQDGLLELSSPVLAKFAIVLLVAFALSFAVSRWVIGRYPRGTATVLVALLIFCLAVRP
jgi:glucan biosynthesis protein C